MMKILVKYKWIDHEQSIISQFANFWKQEMFIDCTILCRGEKFPVHRLVLASCSEYFKEVFDNAQCCHPIIIMNEISSEHLQILLNYIYQVNLVVPQRKLLVIAEEARALKIKGFKASNQLLSNTFSSAHIAENFRLLQKSLSPVVSITKLSGVHDDFSLKRKVLKEWDVGNKRRKSNFSCSAKVQVTKLFVDNKDTTLSILPETSDLKNLLDSSDEDEADFIGFDSFRGRNEDAADEKKKNVDGLFDDVKPDPLISPEFPSLEVYFQKPDEELYDEKIVKEELDIVPFSSQKSLNDTLPTSQSTVEHSPSSEVTKLFEGKIKEDGQNTNYSASTALQTHQRALEGRMIENDRFQIKFICVHKGRGVFAREEIPAGGFLFEYSGEIISKTEGETRLQKIGPNYLYFLGDICIDGNKDHICSLVNDDQRNPNAIMKRIGDDRIGLFVMKVKPIQPGEEITYCYADGFSSLPWRKGRRNPYPYGNGLSTKDASLSFYKAGASSCLENSSSSLNDEGSLTPLDAVCSHASVDANSSPLNESSLPLSSPPVSSSFIANHQPLVCTTLPIQRTPVGTASFPQPICTSSPEPSIFTSFSTPPTVSLFCNASMPQTLEPHAGTSLSLPSTKAKFTPPNVDSPISVSEVISCRATLREMTNFQQRLSAVEIATEVNKRMMEKFMEESAKDRKEAAEDRKIIMNCMKYFCEQKQNSDQPQKITNHFPICLKTTTNDISRPAFSNSSPISMPLNRVDLVKPHINNNSELSYPNGSPITLLSNNENLILPNNNDCKPSSPNGSPITLLSNNENLILPNNNDCKSSSPNGSPITLLSNNENLNLPNNNDCKPSSPNGSPITLLSNNENLILPNNNDCEPSSPNDSPISLQWNREKLIMPNINDNSEPSSPNGSQIALMSNKENLILPNNNDCEPSPPNGSPISLQWNRENLMPNINDNSELSSPNGSPISLMSNKENVILPNNNDGEPSSPNGSPILLQGNRENLMPYINYNTEPSSPNGSPITLLSNKENVILPNNNDCEPSSLNDSPISLQWNRENLMPNINDNSEPSSLNGSPTSLQLNRENFIMPNKDSVPSSPNGSPVSSPVNESNFVEHAVNVYDPQPSHSSQFRKKPSRPCRYCGLFKTNMSRHLLTVHKSEAEIMTVKNLKGKSKSAALRKIRLKGMFCHNLKEINAGRSHNVVKQRSDSTGKLVVCSYCKAFISLSSSYIHIKNCKLKISLQDSSNIETSISSVAIEKLKKHSDSSDLIDCLIKIRNDDVGKFVKSSKLAKLLGEAIIQERKGACTKAKESYPQKNAMQSMRLLARIIMEFICIGREQNLHLTEFDLFNTKYWNFFVKSIDNLGGKSTIKHGLKLGMRTVIQGLIKVVRAETLLHSNSDQDSCWKSIESNANKFSTIFAGFQKRLFFASSKILKRDKRQERRTAETEDIEKAIVTVSRYVDHEISKYLDLAEKEGIPKTLQNFLILRRILVTKLYFFNANRGGEPCRITLKQFKSSFCKPVPSSVSRRYEKEEDKQCLKDYKLVYVESKGDQFVDVIIPAYLLPLFSLLIDYDFRYEANVLPSNIFVFPSTGNSTSHASGYHDMRLLFQHCNVDTLFSSDDLRHRMSSLFGDVEGDLTSFQKQLFFEHMGHSGEVDRNWYRSMKTYDKIVQNSKLLNSLEARGKDEEMVENSDNDQDQDNVSFPSTTEPCPKSFLSCEDEEMVENSDNVQDQHHDHVSFPSTTTEPCPKSFLSCEAQKRKRDDYHKWKAKDEQLVKEAFKSYIMDLSQTEDKGSLPGKKKLKTFLSEHPDVLAGLTASQRLRKLKAKVFNNRKTFRQTVKRKIKFV